MEQRKEEVDEKDIKLINYLMAHNHSSPFEHCTLLLNSLCLYLYVPSIIDIVLGPITKLVDVIPPWISSFMNQVRDSQHKSNRQASNDDLVDPILEYNRIQVWSFR